MRYEPRIYNKASYTVLYIIYNLYHTLYQICFALYVYTTQTFIIHYILNFIIQQSLQRQVAQLAVENEMLKGIVKHRFEDQHVKTQVLSNCRTESLPRILATGNTTTSTTGAGGSGGSPTTATTTKVIEKSDFGLMAAIQAAQRSFCITDPSLPDNPIGKNYD